MTATRGWLPWLCWLSAGALVLAVSFFFDAAVQQWMLQHQVVSVRTFMRAVSRWGDGASQVAVGIFGMVIAYLSGNRRWTVIFATAVIACAMAGLLHPVLKVATGRSRPPVTMHVGWNGPSFEAKYQAFPSGHTISAAAFFGVLVAARRRLGLLLLPLALLIAASRLYLNAHHLSDVVAGLVLGIFCAALAWQIFPDKLERLLAPRV